MDTNNLYNGSCDVVRALNVISGRWKLPILWHLPCRNLRYNELKRKVKGITNIMLTRSLRELESHALVKRIQYAEIPPHVEYELTELGELLKPALQSLVTWAEQQKEFEKDLPINQLTESQHIKDR